MVASRTTAEDFARCTRESAITELILRTRPGSWTAWAGGLTATPKAMDRATVTTSRAVRRRRARQLDEEDTATLRNLWWSPSVFELWHKLYLDTPRYGVSPPSVLMATA